jgi:hypothetical protein
MCRHHRPVRKSRDTAQHTHNVGTTQRLVFDFTPWPLYPAAKVTSLFIEQKTGWTPESVSALGSRETFSGPYCARRIPISIPTELGRRPSSDESGHRNTRRQAVYLQHNTEKRSRNHGCCGKAISIKYYECVSAFLP